MSEPYLGQRRIVPDLSYDSLTGKPRQYWKRQVYQLKRDYYEQCSVEQWVTLNPTHSTEEEAVTYAIEEALRG